MGKGRPVNRHYKIKYYLIGVVDALFNAGVNKSKHVIFQLNYEAQRKRTSEVIHSYSTATTYKKVMSKFSDFLKQEYKLKYLDDFKKLSVDELFVCVDKYFEKQRDVEKLAKTTLQKHISALYKVLGTVNPEIREHFTPDNRAKWRDGLEKQDCDRYNYPDKIVENLKKIDEKTYAIAQLQRLTGARIGDIKKLVVDEENKRVYITKSKGGRDRSVYFDHFPQEFEKVKGYKEIVDRALEQKSFREIRENEYYQALKKACRLSGEIYHGSHSFRYEFAQNRGEVLSRLTEQEQEAYYRKILEDRGLDEENIEKAVNNVKEKDSMVEAIVSEELGHSRLDISREYMKLKGK